MGDPFLEHLSFRHATLEDQTVEAGLVYDVH